MDPNFDIDEAAQAIEADAGQEIPGIRESLAWAKAWMAGRVAAPQELDDPEQN